MLRGIDHTKLWPLHAGTLSGRRVGERYSFDEDVVQENPSKLST